MNAAFAPRVLHWHRDYVGLPFREHGLDRSGVACWGLVRMAYRERLGIDLPAYGDTVDALEAREMAGAWPWVEVPERDAAPFDLVTFRLGGIESHVGIIPWRGHFLHAPPGTTSRVERLDAEHWRALKGRFLRYRAGANSNLARPQARGKEDTLVALPTFDPMVQRIEMTMPEGITVADAVALALPGLPASQRRFLRVTIGLDVVPQDAWARVRPKLWDVVLIRVNPGAISDLFRSALLLAVTVAAAAVGQFYVGPLIAGAEGLAVTSEFGVAAIKAATAATLVLASTALFNALIPPNKPDEPDKTFAIGGFQNRPVPDGPVPQLLSGGMRFAPVFAALPYSESIGEDRWITAAFHCGNGPIDMSAPNPWIGLTPLSDFPAGDYEINYREGYETDPPLFFYYRQVVEEQLSVALSHEDGRQSRFTAVDVEEIEVEFLFPSGLFEQDGTSQAAVGIQVKIEQRLVGTADIVTVEASLSIVAGQAKAFWRTHRWRPAVRGQYEVYWTRITSDGREGISDTVTVSALRGFRPEYPLNYEKPMALVEVRIKASGKLNGTLDNFSIFGRRIMPDYDAGTQTWIDRASSSPASLFRLLLQGPQNTFPSLDVAIDLDDVVDWHAHCLAKGLTFDGWVDGEVAREEMIRQVCHAGRALPHRRGAKRTVIIDRPRTQFFAGITTRNSWDLKESDPPVRLPDAYVVPFIDSTNNYAAARRTVPFPDFVGDPVVIEELALPGNVYPNKVWVEARRRQYEAIARRRSWTVSQDAEHLSVDRGGAAFLAHPVIDRRQSAGRVRSFAGGVVGIDEDVTMVQGGQYRARIVAAADNTSSEWTVATVAGTFRSLTLSGDGAEPQVGDHVMFYSIESTAIEVIVKNIERGDNHTGTLTLIDHAPELDALADAEVPPAWDGRVGEVVPFVRYLLDDAGKFIFDDEGALIVSDDNPAPAVPVIGSISSRTEDVVVFLHPGAGSIPVATYEVEHRLSAALTWSGPTAGSAAGGSVTITGYAAGVEIEVRARAVALTGAASDYGGSQFKFVSSDKRWLPAVEDFAAEPIGGDVWRFSWTEGALAGWQLPAEVAGARIRYRAGAWSAWEDLSPLHTGLAPTNPWTTSTPADDALYTFGILLESTDGDQGDPVLTFAAMPATTGLLITDDAGHLITDDAGDYLT